MDRAELLRCMREAAGALGEFRPVLDFHCPDAVAHLERALRHFDLALAVCRRSAEEDDDDDDDGRDAASLRLRNKW